MFSDYDEPSIIIILSRSWVLVHRCCSWGRNWKRKKGTRRQGGGGGEEEAEKKKEKARARMKRTRRRRRKKKQQQPIILLLLLLLISQMLLLRKKTKRRRERAKGRTITTTGERTESSEKKETTKHPKREERKERNKEKEQDQTEPNKNQNVQRKAQGKQTNKKPKEKKRKWKKTWMKSKRRQKNGNLRQKNDMKEWQRQTCVWPSECEPLHTERKRQKQRKEKIILVGPPKLLSARNCVWPSECVPLNRKKEKNKRKEKEKKRRNHHHSSLPLLSSARNGVWPIECVSLHRKKENEQDKGKEKRKIIILTIKIVRKKGERTNTNKNMLFLSFTHLVSSFLRAFPFASLPFSSFSHRGTMETFMGRSAWGKNHPTTAWPEQGRGGEGEKKWIKMSLSLLFSLFCVLASVFCQSTSLPVVLWSWAQSKTSVDLTFAELSLAERKREKGDQQSHTHLLHESRPASSLPVKWFWLFSPIHQSIDQELARSPRIEWRNDHDERPLRQLHYTD